MAIPGQAIPRTFRAKWPYKFALPMADYRTNPGSVEKGVALDMVGVDGRFTGGVRVFPGFHRLIPSNGFDHRLPEVADAEATPDFFKYAKIQKGTTNYFLRGFVFRVAGSVYYRYYDEERQWWDVVLIDASSTGEIDCTAGGKFLYYAKQGDRGRTIWWEGCWYNVPFGTEEFPFVENHGKGEWIVDHPYNQGGYDLGFGTGFDVDKVTRHVSLTAADATKGFITGIVGKAAVIDSTYGTFPVDNNQIIIEKSDPTVIVTHRVGIRLGDLRRGVYTTLGVATLVTHLTVPSSTPGLTSYKYYLDVGIWMPVFEDGSGTDLSQFNLLEVFCSLEGDSKLYNVAVIDATVVMGSPDATLEEALQGLAPDEPSPDGINRKILQVRIGKTGGYSDDTLEDDWSQVSAVLTTPISPEEMIFQDFYDEDMDEVGSVPRGSRVLYVGGTIYKTPDHLVNEAESGEVWWSNIERVLPEQFPSINQYPSPIDAGAVQAFASSGDHVYAFSDSAFHRLVQIGTQVVAEQIHDQRGLANRFSVSGGGGFIYALGASALYQIEAATGNLSTVGIVERLLLDPNKWGNDKASIFVVFDGQSEALYIVNPVKEEALVVWGTTSVVTRLVDVPFVAGTTGVHPVTGASRHAFFLTENGLVLYPDSDRSSDSLNMTGLVEGVDCDLNGIFSDDIGEMNREFTNGFNFRFAQGTPIISAHDMDMEDGWDTGFSGGFGTPFSTDNKMIDAHLYILRQANADGVYGTEIVRTKIIAQQGDYLFLELENVDSLAIYAGDRWAIAPPYYEIVGWKLQTGDQIPYEEDEMYRRVTDAISSEIREHRGQTSYENWDNGFSPGFGGRSFNQKVYMGARVRYGEEVADCTVKDMAEKPQDCTGKVHVADALLYPVITVVASALDFELRQFTVHGRLEQTDKT